MSTRSKKISTVQKMYALLSAHFYMRWFYSLSLSAKIVFKHVRPPVRGLPLVIRLCPKTLGSFIRITFFVIRIDLFFFQFCCIVVWQWCRIDVGALSITVDMYCWCFVVLFSEPEDLSADELARLVATQKNSRKAVANPKVKRCALIICFLCANLICFN